MSFSLRKLFLAVALNSIVGVLAVRFAAFELLPSILAAALLASVAFLLPNLRYFVFMMTPLCLCLSFLLSQQPSLYYAKFNAVERRLARLPGVEIIKSWKHEDVSLEDCAFTVVLNGRETIELEFFEGQDWIGMFTQLDGVVFWRSDGSRGFASTAKLADHGIEIRDLPEMLAKLDRILSHSQHTMNWDAEPPQGNKWICVRRQVQ